MLPTVLPCIVTLFTYYYIISHHRCSSLKRHINHLTVSAVQKMAWLCRVLCSGSPKAATMMPCGLCFPLEA